MAAIQALMSSPLTFTPVQFFDDLKNRSNNLDCLAEYGTDNSGINLLTDKNRFNFDFINTGVQVLRIVKAVKDITKHYSYIVSPNSMFCPHVEGLDLLSMNISIFGAAKY